MLQPSIASKLRSRQRELGTRETLRFVARRVGEKLHEEEPLLVLVKDLRDIPVPLRRGQVRLEPLEPRHEPALRALNRDRGDRNADDRNAADFADGYRGFAGFLGDELVACYWWCDATMPPHRDMRLFDLGVELGERDAYGFDFYVREDRRAGGTAADFLYQVETALHDRGFDWAWGYVLEDNRGARWLYDARGYQTRWRIDRERVLRRWRNRTVPIEGDGKRA